MDLDDQEKMLRMIEAIHADPELRAWQPQVYKSEPCKIRFKRLVPEAITPTKATPGSAGFDLHITSDFDCDPITPLPEPWALPTGIAIELPPGYEAQVRMRSGLAAKGLWLANGVGTIDCDYRGEILVLVHARKRHVFKPGDRIAQLVIQRVPEVELEEAAELGETERGAGGFGSTGA